MLHAVKTLGQKRSKPVGKPAELLKRARYGRKRKAEAGRKMGRRETHVLAGSNLSLPRLQVQIAGLERSNQKTEAKSVLRTCKWMGREEDDE